MKELSGDELKKIEISLLNKVDAICRKENLRYSLAYGTLIGAVRHKGFIPWDDDIDILMPRDDYEKFLTYFENVDVDFSLKTFKSDNKYAYTFAKVCDNQTIIEEEFSNRDNASMGVYIDIFPIDALSGDYENAVDNFEAKEFERDLIVAYNWKKYTRSKTGSVLREPFRIAFFILSRTINVHKYLLNVEQFYAKNDWEKSQYAGNAVDATYGVKNVMPIDLFNTYTDIEFEGSQYMCLREYDSFLKNIYGDYMKLPPIEKQVTHHSFKAYWID